MVARGNYTVVAGAVNMDIGGTSESTLIMGESNPGKIITEIGGVGRNIAHNLRLLGENVTFLTAYGYDHYGQRILSECEKIQLDLSKALLVHNMQTSTYVYLCGPDGEMEMAVNDMEICKMLTPAYFEKHIDEINHARLLVIDANIPEESIDYLTKKAGIPIFADLVSIAKAQKIKPYLSRIDTIKPNLNEAQILTGITVKDEGSLNELAFKLLDTGVKNAYISLAKDGILAVSENETVSVKSCKSNVVDVTGAGDAAMAALCYSYIKGKSQKEAAQYANAAASIAIESKNTISEYMSVNQIERRIRENYL